MDEDSPSVDSPGPQGLDAARRPVSKLFEWRGASDGHNGIEEEEIR
jgi:hypothetical protein